MYGKPDALDRLVQALLALAALFALVFGLFMLADPLGWYQFCLLYTSPSPRD